MRLPHKATSYALLVGVSRYQTSELDDLPMVVNNLNDLKAALTHPVTGAFDMDKCLILSNPANAKEVSTVLHKVARLASDTLLVYFAGHGLPGLRGNDLFLALMGTDLDHLPFSALRYDDLRLVLLDSGQFRIDNQILILDCCFSGRAIGGMSGKDPWSDATGVLDISGTYVLTATASNMRAIAPPGGRHTAFTGELITLLRQGIPGGSLLLSLGVIYQYLARKLISKGLPRPKQMNLDTVADLALACNAAATSVPPPAPSEAVAIRPPAVRQTWGRLRSRVIGGTISALLTLSLGIVIPGGTLGGRGDASSAPPASTATPQVSGPLVPASPSASKGSTAPQPGVTPPTTPTQVVSPTPTNSTGQPSLESDCQAGWLCGYDNVNFGYPRMRISPDCGRTNLSNWGWQNRIAAASSNFAGGSFTFFNEGPEAGPGDDVALFSVSQAKPEMRDVSPYRDLADYVVRNC